jgi:hypothetical protein
MEASVGEKFFFEKKNQKTFGFPSRKKAFFGSFLPGRAAFLALPTH